MLSQVVKKFLPIVEEGLVVQSFYCPALYADEPKLWSFTAKVVDVSQVSSCGCQIGYAGGASFDKEKAILKALGEAVERYCLGVYQESNLISASYKDVKSKSIVLESVVSFSENQLKQDNFFSCVWNLEDIFRWVKSFSVFDEKEVLVPAQLVFVPYQMKDEKIIRLPISTGGACGLSKEECLLRGILEVIERDAFMIHYLSNTCGLLVNIDNDFRLRKIKDYFLKYRLELYLISLPTDLGIYTFLALLIDRTGIGPAVSAGLKSGIDPFVTAIGAIEECWHSRPWIRDELNKFPNLEKIRQNAKKMIDAKERGLYWSSVDMITYVDNWINRDFSLDFNDLKPLAANSLDSQINYLLNVLKNKNHSIYYVDLTTDEVARHGFKTLKVIIPSLQPLYLDEPFPYLGGSRIYEVPYKIGLQSKIIQEKKINTIPHFFL